MDKLFDIVRSYIPEDQVTDIKSKFDGELKRVSGKTETNVRKELSEKYKVNFFEEDVTKAFSETNFVTKELYDGIGTKLAEETNKLEELNKTVEALSTEKVNNEKNKSLYDSQINLVSNGLRVDRLELIKPHITGDVEADLTTIKEGYPELFLTKEQRQKHINPNNDEGLSDFEKYIKKEQEKK